MLENLALNPGESEKTFKRRRTACADLERILVVGNGSAPLGRQPRRVSTGGLVHFSSGAGHYALVSVMRRVARAGSVWRRARGRILLRYMLLLYHRI